MLNTLAGDLRFSKKKKKKKLETYEICKRMGLLGTVDGMCL